jgi:uncharacterized protein YsxB (DUF464 family)
MIKVEFNCNLEFFLLSLKVVGHAGQAESGHDLVCASASILAYTIASLVESSTERMMEKPYIKLGEGDAEITCYPQMRQFGRIASFYTTVREGFKLLAARYPEYISYTDVTA